ncbi:small ribosomal subunit protein uS15m isoform X1 [Anabrus simplex]|uniref:small ribosomal subunit protein uS15m isoform X1 n=1 Tax=Anabrus simplex TaxID=316456 RepID=UPI0035A39110
MFSRLRLLHLRRYFVLQNESVYSFVSQNNITHGSSKCVVFNDRYMVFPDFSSHTRGFKSDLKIKWVRPTKVPCVKPEKSGDLKPLPQVDLKQYPLGFEKSEELKDADAHVKRIFSLEFMPRNKTMAFFRADLVNSVKRHALDRSSMEARIAAMTGGIRDMQASMETCSRNKKTKVRLKELIDKRKKYLKYLRRWDYKRFEWLLEKLDLVFRPPPDHFHWVTRKDSLRKLTDRYCEKIKEERLASYRESLESQKAAFLQEKAAKLKWIIEEEEACGIKPSFNQNDIDKVLKQLKELEIGQGIIRET